MSVINSTSKIKIDTTSYELSSEYYKLESTPKKKICLMDTLMHDMSHIERLLIRKDNNPKNSPTFTIDEEGTIFQHYDPKYYSEMFGDEYYNKTTISVAFTNLGWLQYDCDKDCFKNWYGMVVNKNRCFEKPYRDNRYWYTYTEKQLKSAIKLCAYLCENFLIKNDFTGHVFRMSNEDDPKHFNGIVTRGNIFDNYTDINPAFEIKKFTKAIQSLK